MDKFREEHDHSHREEAERHNAVHEHEHEAVKPDKHNWLNTNEEMAADFAAISPVYAEEDGNAAADDKEISRSNADSGSFALGWVALVFAAASWFIWPAWLGAAATVLGFIAFRQGARGLGGWSMALGMIALLLYLVVVPFYYAVT